MTASCHGTGTILTGATVQKSQMSFSVYCPVKVSESLLRFMEDGTPTVMASCKQFTMWHFATGIWKTWCELIGAGVTPHLTGYTGCCNSISWKGPTVMDRFHCPACLLLGNVEFHCEIVEAFVSSGHKANRGLQFCNFRQYSHEHPRTDHH